MSKIVYVTSEAEAVLLRHQFSKQDLTITVAVKPEEKLVDHLKACYSFTDINELNRFNEELGKARRVDIQNAVSDVKSVDDIVERFKFNMNTLIHRTPSLSKEVRDYLVGVLNFYLREWVSGKPVPELKPIVDKDNNGAIPKLLVEILEELRRVKDANKNVVVELGKHPHFVSTATVQEWVDGVKPSTEASATTIEQWLDWAYKNGPKPAQSVHLNMLEVDEALFVDTIAHPLRSEADGGNNCIGTIIITNLDKLAHDKRTSFLAALRPNRNVERARASVSLLADVLDAVENGKTGEAEIHGFVKEFFDKVRAADESIMPKWKELPDVPNKFPPAGTDNVTFNASSGDNAEYLLQALIDSLTNPGIRSFFAEGLHLINAEDRRRLIKTLGPKMTLVGDEKSRPTLECALQGLLDAIDTGAGSYTFGLIQQLPEGTVMELKALLDLHKQISKGEPVILQEDLSLPEDFVRTVRDGFLGGIGQKGEVVIKDAHKEASLTVTFAGNTASFKPDGTLEIRPVNDGPNPVYVNSHQHPATTLTLGANKLTIKSNGDLTIGTNYMG